MKKIIFFLILILSLTLPETVKAWVRGHFYVIGVGPAGPEMATLQALETIKRMDVIIASPFHVKLFADYIGNKPVLFDPWKGLFDYKGKDYRKLTKEELAKFKVERFRIRDARVAQIKSLLKKGKDVGLLDSGNPCLFGPSHWYIEEFDPHEVVIIPGMGCDAAAMAVLKRSVIPAHGVYMVIQTAPFLLMGPNLTEEKILKDLSKYPATYIFYMALWSAKKLFAVLKKYFSPDMPCAVVYWAGYPGRQYILRGTIADMGEKIAKQKEKFMGLLLIGRFLEGKPYEAAMRAQQKKLK